MNKNMGKQRKSTSKKITTKKLGVTSKKKETKKEDKTSLIKTKPKRKRAKKKASAKVYFTQETEKAIIEYNNEDDMDIREEIYKSRIEFPFQKLVENVFNRFKFSYFETCPMDVQKETLAHLVLNLGKYDPSRKSKTHEDGKTKAFSYFSVIAKNFLILLNNSNYKKFQQNVEISEEQDENTLQLQHIDSYHTDVELDEFMKLTISFWEENIPSIFSKKRDKDIAYAVVELMRNSKRIDAFNKKALYLYIREISSCKTQQITKVINKMRQYYKTIYEMYLNNGDIEKESVVI